MAERSNPVGKRKRVEIAPEDQRKIFDALEAWAAPVARGDAGTAAEFDRFVGLRTRAFVYLLWDGAVRTSIAVSLNAEDVVERPDKLRVVQQVQQEPCEANRYRQQSFYLSDRTRAALKDYLAVVREDGWLPSSRFEGPLFLSSYHQGTGKRLSARTAIQAWRKLLVDHTDIKVPYQVDDIVYTGRKAFLEAADGNSAVLAEHASITSKWASAGYTESSSDGSSPRDVLARMQRGKSK